MLYYTYDNIDRLTRENNSKLEKTFTYEYDAGGNITSKKTYVYTAGILGTATETNTYTYGNAKWKDQLTSYGGTGITYDACGNPLSYKGATLAWTRGRLLNSLTKQGTIAPYQMEHNAQGIRISKSILDGAYLHRVDYTLEGSNIIKEVTSDVVWGDLSQSTVEYIYNHSGLVGFKRGLVNYYYLKNFLGDIIAIYNASNTLQARYSYDAWGNCTVQNVVGTVGNENPFRYRGYFWDNDLQLYYCQSRYYDPQVGRWISPDTLEYLEPEQLNGLNLYAYCGNNPIMFTDRFGTTKWWEWLLAGAIVVGLMVAATFASAFLGATLLGAAIGGGISLISQAVSTGELNWGQFALDIGVGALSGAVGASGISRGLATIAGGIIGGGSSIASDLIAGKEINWAKAGLSFGIGAIAGYLGGAGAKNTTKMGQAIAGDVAVIKAKAASAKVADKILKNAYSTAVGAKIAVSRVTNSLANATINAAMQYGTVSIMRALSFYGAGTLVATTLFGLFGW